MTQNSTVFWGFFWQGLKVHSNPTKASDLSAQNLPEPSERKALASFQIWELTLSTSSKGLGLTI